MGAGVPGKGNTSQEAAVRLLCSRSRESEVETVGYRVKRWERRATLLDPPGHFHGVALCGADGKQGAVQRSGDLA